MSKVMYLFGCMSASLRRIFVNFVRRTSRACATNEILYLAPSAHALETMYSKVGYDKYIIKGTLL